MDFNFVDDTETQEDDEEWCDKHDLLEPCVLCHQETQEDDDEFLDLSDLYDEEDEDEKLEVAGYAISFEEDLPEAKSITDPEVRAKARKSRRKKSSNKDPYVVGVPHAPSLHGLCKEGRGDGGRVLSAHHSLCQQYEEWHIKANHLCSCDCHDYESIRKELENGKDASKTTNKSRGQRVRSEPESLSGSDDEGFVLVLD